MIIDWTETRQQQWPSFKGLCGFPTSHQRFGGQLASFDREALIERDAIENEIASFARRGKARRILLERARPWTESANEELIK